MKRRDFLRTSSTGLAVMAIPALVRAEPCPPPAVSVEGGATVSTSCGPSGPAPSWFVNAPERAWTAIAGASNETIKAVVPNPWPSNPGSHPGNITAAWTGGSIDQIRGEYLMCANGGHADYPGNECYAISMRSESPKWRRLSDPTPNSHIVFDDNAGTNAAINADGRPRAMHSTFACFGDGRVWFPEQNSFSSPSGGTTHAVLSYNRDMLGDGLTPLPWTAANLGPWTIHPKPNFNGMGVTPTAFGRAAWDKVGHKVWAVGGNNNKDNPHYWSVSTSGATLGQATVYRKSGSLDNFNSWTVIAPDLRIMIMGGEYGKKIYVFFMDKAGASDDWQTVTNVTGTGFFQMGAGGAYIKANHSIAIANPKNTGSMFYKLQIPTKISGNAVVYDPAGQWVWSQVNPSGGTSVYTPPEGNNDTYSKWNVIEDMGNGQSAIVVVTSIEGPVYVYKVPKSGI
jgi:hypothetical protein